MPVSIKVAPPNSLIGISDVEKGDVPTVNTHSGISATDTCILIGCWPEIDGETEITLGPAAEVNPGGSAAFDAQLGTPTGRLQVITVEWKPLLEATVKTPKTRVRIWPNRAQFPDKITIGFD